MHWVALHDAIKGNTAVNILGCVSWEHGQDFLLGHSISLRGSSSYPVTLVLVVTLRACDAHAGGVNANKAQGLPWATPSLVEQLIPAFMLVTPLEPRPRVPGGQLASLYWSSYPFPASKSLSLPIPSP